MNNERSKKNKDNSLMTLQDKAKIWNIFESEVINPEMLFNQRASDNKKNGKNKTLKNPQESKIIFKEESAKESAKEPVKEKTIFLLRRSPFHPKNNSLSLNQK